MTLFAVVKLIYSYIINRFILSINRRVIIVKVPLKGFGDVHKYVFQQAYKIKPISANAAYWNIAVLASSLHNMLKNNFLTATCKKSRPKTLRFLFYAMAGQIVRHAHKAVMKIYGSVTGRSWFHESIMRMEACFGVT
jgi:hypothetical protein